MKKPDILFSLFLLVGAVLLYSPSLGSGFVFDDEYLIVGDHSIRAQDNLTGFFLRPSFSYYRPLRSISYHLDYRYWELNPLGYHLTSILLHGFCALAFFLLLKSRGVGFSVRAGAGLIFLLHPIATEPVIYLSARAELLGTLFSLLFLLAGTGFVFSGRPWRALLAMASLLAAFLSKESFLVLPLLWLVVAAGDQTPPAGQRRRRGISIAAFILAGAFFCFRFFLLQAPAGPGRFSRLLTYPQILLKAPSVLLAYLRLLLFPVGLSPHHPLASAPLPSPAALAAQLAALAGLLILLCLLWKRGRWFRTGALWLAIALLPVSNIYPLTRILAEKYLYFALPGFAWLAAGFFFGSGRKAKMFRAGLFGAAAVAFLLLTLNRQPDWRDNYTLWEKTASRSAADPLILFNLGTARIRAGEAAEGLADLEAAEEMLPGQPIIREKIADVMGMLGRHQEALQIYQKLLERFPDSPSLLLKAGFTYDSRGYPQLAERYYEEAIGRAGEPGPDRPARLYAVYRELSTLKEARGEFGRAAELLETALALFPADPDGEKQLASLYRRDDQIEKAESIRERQTAGDASSPAGLFARGQQLEQAGRFQEAMQLYHRTLKLDPSFAPAYFELGGLLAARREYEAAEKFIEAGLKLQGDDFRHHTNLGTVRQFQGKYPEAVAAYRRSLGLEESYIAHYNIGFLYLNRLFDPESARPHLEAALALAEDPEQQQNLAATLERIENEF
ncbi:MAG: tetratricopeptide repeat protein [Candidatus Erginobacter occultus]|nr:tetratricopeptide repeat protein [Candidatus Erginobacter occultus]